MFRSGSCRILYFGSFHGMRPHLDLHTERCSSYPCDDGHEGPRSWFFSFTSLRPWMAGPGKICKSPACLLSPASCALPDAIILDLSFFEFSRPQRVFFSKDLGFVLRFIRVPACTTTHLVLPLPVGQWTTTCYQYLVAAGR